MSKSVYERVVAIIGKELDYDTSYVVLSTRLDSLPMDSLEFIELVQALSVNFNIPISTEEAAEFETLNDIMDLLERKRAISA